MWMARSIQQQITNSHILFFRACHTHKWSRQLCRESYNCSRPAHSLMLSLCAPPFPNAYQWHYSPHSSRNTTMPSNTVVVPRNTKTDWCTTPHHTTPLFYRNNCTGHLDLYEMWAKNMPQVLHIHNVNPLLHVACCRKQMQSLVSLQNFVNWPSGHNFMATTPFGATNWATGTFSRGLFQEYYGICIDGIDKV